jgi:sulfite exporter TauE/SafE
LPNLALAPFLLSPEINGIVYLVVGIAMSAAGAIVLRKNRYPHLHLLAEWHELGATEQVAKRSHFESSRSTAAPPPKWTIIHGFIAGFGFGGFSLFINTVAAPAMPNPWLGFLPGLLFGFGTMIMLVIIGGLFGVFLQWLHSLSAEEIKRIGSQTGGRTLFFGGLLFGVAGMVMLSGLERYLPVDTGYLLIALFIAVVVIPAFVHSWKEVLEARERKQEFQKRNSEAG